MKKKLIFVLLALMLLIGLIYYGYNVYLLNNVESEVFSFQKNIEDKYSFVGVFDDRLYYVDSTKLIATNSDNTISFEKNIGLGIANIIYDKYIFIAEKTGQVRALDRKTGEEIKTLDIGENIAFLEQVDKQLISYSKNSVTTFDVNFKGLKTKEFDHTPIKFRENGNTSSVIFLDRDIDGLKSRLRVYNGETITYEISSVDEAFLSVHNIDNRNLVLSNSYLYFIENDNIVKKVFLINPRAIDVKDNKIVVADNESLKIFDKDLKLVSEIPLGFKANKISIRSNSIIIVGDNVVASYEDGNLIKSNTNNMKDCFINNHGVYVIFPDRIEKVKAY